VAHLPEREAVPGVRVAYTDEREIQHALDAGALVVVVRRSTPRRRRSRRATGPTSRRWAAAAMAAARRSRGDVGGVPGVPQHDQRQRGADRDIETLEGLKDADEIAKCPA